MRISTICASLSGLALHDEVVLVSYLNQHGQRTTLKTPKGYYYSEYHSRGNRVSVSNDWANPAIVR